MVIFTCNNCGGLVNKTKVKKHLNYNTMYLQDFNHEMIKGNCQCIIEDQRHSAKQIVPKPTSEKCKHKPASWEDIVQSLSKRTDLQNDEIRFLNIIAKFDIIPRRKKKFENFSFSIAPVYKKKTHLVKKVFDMIEAKYYKAQVPVKSAEITNIQNKKNYTDNMDKNDLVQDVVPKVKTKKDVGHYETIKNKIVNENFEKKLKKKSPSQSIESVNDEFVIKIDENIKQHLEKRKKKKEKKLLDNNIVVEENLEIKEKQLNSAKKAKKIKKSSKVEESIDINVNGKTKTSNINSIKKTPINSAKKLKIKSEELLHDINSGDKTLKKNEMKFQHKLVTITIVIETPKEPSPKKNKRKLNDDEEKEESQPKVIKIEKSPQVPKVQNDLKFEWIEAINQILQRKRNRPISIRKVMKRVLNEYYFLNKTTTKTETELEKIFLKKLKKIKSVSIDNDKIKLVNC